MDNKRLHSPSPVIQSEVFFTQENYKKYSCLPSFVEFLEKHPDSAKDGDKQIQHSRDTIGHIPQGTIESTGNHMDKSTCSGVEREGSNKDPASLGPEMEFPFVSKISLESQRLFLEMFEVIRSGKLAKVDLQKMRTVQDLKKEVLTEQEEFQNFVYNHAKTNHHCYNFIHPDIWGNFKAELEGNLKERIGKYPQKYSLYETIGLAVGAVFKSDAVLTFEQTLLQKGNVPVLRLPESTNIFLEPVKEAEATMSAKVVSEDSVAVSLARKHQVDIVISSSGLNTLVNNQPPKYEQQWQLPITVLKLEETHNQSDYRKVVFIDKPLPPQSVSPQTVNWKFYKRTLRRLMCQKNFGGSVARRDGVTLRNDMRLEDEQPSRVGQDTKTYDTDRGLNKKLTSTIISDNGNRKRRAQENSEPSLLKKSRVSGAEAQDETLKKESVSSYTIEGEKCFVYNLWRFGQFKVLIRCSVDAYRIDTEIAKSVSFFSILPKLEYQPMFGHEKHTVSEAQRFWLHGYIRPQTKLICGRFDVFNSKLLRVDELSFSDVLQQGTMFNPSRGMKMVFQVFQALKRLPEDKYLLSHKCGEMHVCLYKSVGLSNSCAFDLRKLHSPVLTNFTEDEIPWVAIDCNLFLPWQIQQKRIPCTFPANSAKELAQMAQKEQETKPKRKKNKKGKKKRKGKVKISAHDKSQEQKRPDRKSMDKGKLFASFYDIQPTEKESEVFAVARRASGPITYEDIDFL